MHKRPTNGHRLSGERVGMDPGYHVRWTPALTLPQVRYGLSVLLLETFVTLGVSSICRRVQRQCMRDELARFDHHRTRTCLPPRQ